MSKYSDIDSEYESEDGTINYSQSYQHPNLDKSKTKRIIPTKSTGRIYIFIIGIILTLGTIVLKATEDIYISN